MLEAVCASGAGVECHAEGDGAREARYRLALVRMPPIPGRDPARARRELIDLAQAAPADGVALSARYALGVLDEQAGNIERAAGAYARIVVERPDAEAASRARCGFARFLLSRGEFGPAAGWFQEALDGGAPEALAPGAQRDLALRAALRRDTPALRWSALTSKPAAVPTSKGAALLASDGQGGIVVFDHKSDEVQAFDAKGRPRAPMALPDVSALASDPYGRVFAATKDKIVRLDGGTPVPVLDLGSFASPSAIAADAAGSIWIADRKGDRVGRWVPGAGAPVVVRDAKGAGVRALAVRGQDVIAAEEKTGALILISGAGGETAFGSAPFRRPVALSVDAAGRVAVLDEKAGTLTRLTAAGAVEDTLSLSPQGIEKPLSIASARNGAVRVLDAASGSVFEAP